MRVICCVIGSRNDALVMVRRLLGVLLLMLVRQSVANLNSGRCDGDR
jgi:hypothetical protein